MSATPSLLIIGHRGASGYRPEHTREAYELAIELGADAVEPDIVATRDGILVIRHENNIADTTDVAGRREFADRRTTRVIDGTVQTGWFTEDFTWAELATLRTRERLGEARPESAACDGRSPILRLRDLLSILDAHEARGRRVLLVAEIKHATYFDSLGLPLGELFAREIQSAGWGECAQRVIVESFERRVLGQLRERGVPARLVFLVEASGSPADDVARLGGTARPFSHWVTAAGLAELAAGSEGYPPVDGVSVPKSLLLRRGEFAAGDGTNALVERAHAAGLTIFTWTLRPENTYLSKNFRLGSDPVQWGDWQGEFGLILRSGVDGVFCDHPDLVAALRR
ncbi:glycerophosphodiester phosphodiesterase [Klugiella xanthotipulae]|uniref:glycerophosphodiester phosphodiesterase n=1 Tax=Klugiella xanthotipulae TaxID=244735 RepID=A0A543I526_9MICO|nr:glycerophosphodiester phosphodiesterase family protein [Klugiella xanthotipulae]TQM65706.1 glycerophosphoryl diester phosphodiesterase [Klugiella xanthotipulae]